MKQPTLESRSDNHLLRLGRNGSEDAFLTLYQRHQAAVFRFAFHMSGSRELAEEVVQEVFLALLGQSSNYSAERGTLEAFLIGIARNQVRRQLRDARPFHLPESCTVPRHPIDILGSNAQLQALRKAILALPESYRAVTVLCDLEELTYADAAQRLGCAVGTVRSRLHRARAILEAKLRRREQCQMSITR